MRSKTFVLSIDYKFNKIMIIDKKLENNNCEHPIYLLENYNSNELIPRNYTNEQI
jgi:hypothetical protein